MADISTEIAEIQEASYGSEVRQAIVDGLNKVNAETLPAVSASDAGKFLTVNNNGQWEVRGGGLIPTPTGTKNITENGTHDVTNYASASVNVPNSYSASDEGKVVDDGALVSQTSRNVTQNGTYDTTINDEVVVNVQGGGGVIQPLSATQNGTYTPPSGVDGYAPVVVSVSGGGGVELITRDQWDALTTQQKQSYGLVSIQDQMSGYIRGQLVYGADYNEYLPYSQDASAFDCIATYDNFNPNSLTWGDGDNPIQFSALCTQYMSEDAIYCDAKSSSKQIYIPLDSTTSDFTVYVVLKGLAYVSTSGGQVIGSVASWSSGNIINYNSCYASNTWRSSTWGNDINFINTNGDYVVLAMRSDNLRASWFGYNNLKRLDVSYTQHGNKFEIGYREVGNAYESDLAVKFVALIQEAEDNDIIRNNIINLANMFNIA